MKKGEEFEPMEISFYLLIEKLGRKGFLKIISVQLQTLLPIIFGKFGYAKMLIVRNPIPNTGISNL